MSATQSSLYMIGNDDRSVVKIGITTHVQRRLSAIQNGSIYPLSILESLVIAKDIHRIEKNIHRYLAHHKYRGEWFDLRTADFSLAWLVEQARQAMAQEQPKRSRKEGMTGEELKAIRQEHDLTQRALGELLGYNANYIMRLERGHENITPRFERLVRNMLGQKKRKKSSQTI